VLACAAGQGKARDGGCNDNCSHGGVLLSQTNGKGIRMVPGTALDGCSILRVPDFLDRPPEDLPHRVAMQPIRDPGYGSVVSRVLERRRPEDRFPQAGIEPRCTQAFRSRPRSMRKPRRKLLDFLYARVAFQLPDASEALIKEAAERRYQLSDLLSSWASADNCRAER
jgi:hypothetical protein